MCGSVGRGEYNRLRDLGGYAADKKSSDSLEYFVSRRVGMNDDARCRITTSLQHNWKIVYPKLVDLEINVLRMLPRR